MIEALVELRRRAALPRDGSMRSDMTEEQEQMLRVVLRNQEVIMNALAELLTADPVKMLKDPRRGDKITDLGTCVGFTHYCLADLARTTDQARSKPIA
jgi:hypothetical protein